VEHLLDAEFPTLFTVGIELAIGAELTAEHTDIGRFNVEISVKEDLISM
jgi:hypothetical protein